MTHPKSEPVVVSVAFGGVYQAMQSRLALRLADVGHGRTLMHQRDPVLEGWPTHAQAPYSFKCAAIQDAIDRGHTMVCWMDCSCVPVRPLDPLWEIAREHGAVIFRDGWTNDEWCTDECFALCGTPKAEYGHTTHVLAGCFILDLTRPRTLGLWEHYRDVCRDGRALRGPVVIDRERRVKPYGHRHDQSVLSLLAARHRIPLTDVTGLIGYASNFEAPPGSSMRPVVELHGP